MFDFDDSYDNEFYTFNWLVDGKPEYSFWLCDNGVAFPQYYDDSYLDRPDFIQALKAARVEQRRIFSIENRSAMFDYFEVRPFKFQVRWWLDDGDLRGVTMIVTEHAYKDVGERVVRELIEIEHALDFLRDRNKLGLPSTSVFSSVPAPSNPLPKRDTSGYVYLIKASTGQYKIGSTSSPDERIAMIARDLPQGLRAVLPNEPLVLTYVHRFYSLDRWTMETVLRNRYKKKRIFQTKDWFNLDPADVAAICTIQDEDDDEEG